jgi:hypothetical protein
MLRQDIIDWLETSRLLHFEAAKKAGLPPSITVPRTIVESVTDTGYTSYEGTFQTTPLSHFGIAWKIWDQLDPSANDARHSPALALYQQYGDRCRVPSGISDPFENNPPRWIFQYLLLPLRNEYFSQLPSLDAGNQEIATAMADEFLRFLESDSFTLVTALPLAGLRLETDPLVVNHVLLRSLKPDEIAVLSDDAGARFLRRNRGKTLSYPFPRITTERTVLEVRKAFRKDSGLPVDAFPKKLILALFLLGFEPNGEGAVSVWTEPGPVFWNSGMRYALPDRGAIKEITAADLRRAVSLSELIPEGAVGMPGNRQEVALHRFSLGSVERSAADKLIDYVIAMESFLLPSGSEGELRFKFGLLGAWYLAGDHEERALLSKELQTIYVIRSKIVHGSTPESEALLLAHALNARQLAARLLIKGLDQGWPSHDTLKKMALGSAAVSGLANSSP